MIRYNYEIDFSNYQKLLHGASSCQLVSFPSSISLSSTSSSLVLFSPQHAPNDVIQQAELNVSTV